MSLIQDPVVGSATVPAGDAVAPDTVAPSEARPAVEAAVAAPASKPKPARRAAAVKVASEETKPAVKKPAAKRVAAKKAAAKKAVAKKAAASKPAEKSAPVTAPADAPIRSAKPAKEGKAAKVKMVRDSFTMPSDDFVLIERIKARALDWKQPVKKSEVLRAALHALMALNDTRLKAALSSLAPIKKGRPNKA